MSRFSRLIRLDDLASAHGAPHQPFDRHDDRRRNQCDVDVVDPERAPGTYHAVVVIVAPIRPSVAPVLLPYRFPDHCRTPYAVGDLRLRSRQPKSAAIVDLDQADAPCPAGIRAVAKAPLERFQVVFREDIIEQLVTAFGRSFVSSVLPSRPGVNHPLTNPA